MKTFKDLFLNESADIPGIPRRIIKASLRMARADNGSNADLAPVGGSGDADNESEEKRPLAGDEGRRIQQRDNHSGGASFNRTGSAPP